jgi:8-oxo-dGTP diphosphatase
MSHASSTITVVAGLIQQGGRLLVCQRRRDGAFALKWEFPGGKVEPGETYENGLRRELREELGIEAHIGPEAYRTRHDYPGKYTVELLFYHVVDFSGACTIMPSRKSAGPTRQTFPPSISWKGMLSSLPS